MQEVTSSSLVSPTIFQASGGYPPEAFYIFNYLFFNDILAIQPNYFPSRFLSFSAR